MYSPKFQKWVKEKYSVNIRYLSKASKAFLAELGISIFKKRASTILAAQTEGKEKHNWIRHIPLIVETHNAAYAYDTKFRRNEINDKNFFSFLDERYKVKDSTVSFNAASIDSRSLSAAVAKSAFKYLPGERVLVTRQSLRVYDGEGTKNNTFVKSSVVGSFSEILFVIASATLRCTSKNDLVAGK